jgi:hypothetical protein
VIGRDHRRAAAAQHLLSGRLAPATQRKYARFVALFEQWRAAAGCMHVAIDAPMLSAWAVDLWLDGRGPQVPQALAAVRAGLPFEVHSKELSDMVKAIARDCQRASALRPRRQPMPVDFVSRYMSAQPPGVSLWDWRRNCAAAAYALRSMARPGESDSLLRQQILFRPDGSMLVAPQHRKNDPYAALAGGLGSPYEPSSMVAAMRAYSDLRGDAPGPFWLSQNRQPLASGFLNELAKLLGASYDSSDLLTGHSFRIGGATAAAAAGVDIATIQAIGGWRSEAVLRYIRKVAACAASVTRRMGL